MRKKLIKAPFLVLSHRTRVRSYGGGYSVRGRSNDKEGMWIPWVPSPHQFGVAVSEFSVAVSEFCVAVSKFGVAVSEFGVAISKFRMAISAVMR